MAPFLPPKNCITKDVEKIYSKIEKDYINKSKTIEDSLKTIGEKYYRKESFVYVINIGLDAELSMKLTFPEIRAQLPLLYNFI